MATGKRYYWLKLRESFLTSDAVDYLMSQPNGANYVVLYQILHLKTINTDGRLSRQIGEVIIPYDVAKIARDTKWFSQDTVRIALGLYKALGLVYEDTDGALVLADHDKMVGSETDWANQKQRQRLGPGADNVHTNVRENVHTDIRDKILDIRDIEIEGNTQLYNPSTDQENDTQLYNPSTTEGGTKDKREYRRFSAPTLEQVAAYCAERNNGIDPEAFVDFYARQGWKLSNGRPMVDWKAAVRTWEKRRKDDRRPRQESSADAYARMMKEGYFD